MKRKICLVLIAFIILPCLFLFAGCDKNILQEIVNHKVYFYVDNEIYSTSQFDSENKMLLPLNPTKENYEFAGWYFDDDVWEILFTDNVEEFTKLPEQINAYSKWVALFNDYHIQISDFIKNNDGYILNIDTNSTKFNFENYIKVSDDFSYVISTSKNKENALDSKNVDIIVGENVYYLIFTPINGNSTICKFIINVVNNATVSFVTNNNNQIDPLTVEVGSKITQPNIISKTGYIFTGWFLDDNTEWNFVEDVVKTNITLYAHWTACTYTITYNLNGGKNSSDNPENYTYGSITTFENATRNGYEFAGWYLEEDFKTQIAQTKNTTIGNIVLYAKWNLIEYTITFNTNGGTLENGYYQIISIETQTVFLPTPIKEGYEFAGWYLDLGLSQNAFIAPNKNYILYAKWIEIEEDKLIVLSDGETTFSKKVCEVAPDGVLNKTTIKSLLNQAGYTKENLVSIEIDEGIVEIDYETFFLCNSLTNVTIHNITTIGDYAFYNCNSLTNVTIHNITTIGDYAFYHCDSLTNVTILNGIKNIGKGAFYCCYALTNIEIVNSLISVGDSAFCYCTSLTNLDFLKSFVNISKEMFMYCSSLASVKIQNSITSIGSNAFYGCDLLNDIYIPNSVLNISYGVLGNCNSLTQIVVDVDNRVYDSRNNCNAIIETLSNTLIAGCNNTQIPNSVEHIGEEAFYNCKLLTNIELSSAVNSIEGGAFLGCELLHTINLPAGLTVIGDFAFRDCTALENIEIPSNTTNIGAYAFYVCSSLTNITIPSTITSINRDTFGHCSSLISVTISNSVTSINDEAFYFCSSLTSITIPSSVTYISESAFSCCSSLRSIIVDENNTVYDSRNYCNAIIETSTNTLIVGCKNTIIPNSVTNIDNYAFCYCGSLTSVIIPDGVTNIGIQAFFNCTSLTNITIPNSVTKFGKSAFSCCSSLADISYNGTEDQWNQIEKGDNWDYYSGDYIIHFLGEQLEEYVITFNTNGGTLENGYTQTILSSDKNISLPIPTKLGYEFKGWYLDDNLTKQAVILPNQNYTLYAKWTVVEENDLIILSDGETTFSKKVSEVAPDGVLNRLIIQRLLEQAGFVKGSAISIEIGEGIIHIDDYTFSLYTYNISSIKIPNSLITIGKSVFSLTNLENCIVYENAKYLGNENNPYFILMSVIDKTVSSCNINADTKYLNCYAFNNCINLTSITIPDSIIGIGTNVFAACRNLTEIVFSKNIHRIEDGAFIHCDNLKTLIIPDTITEIGRIAFCYSGSLTSITIPSSVTSIGDSAFCGCNSLTIYCEAISKPSGWHSDWDSTDCAVYWYSETEPTTSGNYWHYVDGVVTKW